MRQRRCLELMSVVLSIIWCQTRLVFSWVKAALEGNEASIITVLVKRHRWVQEDAISCESESRETTVLYGWLVSCFASLWCAGQGNGCPILICVTSEECMSWIYACQQYITPAAKDLLEPLNKIMSNVCHAGCSSKLPKPSRYTKFCFLMQYSRCKLQWIH